MAGNPRYDALMRALVLSARPGVGSLRRLVEAAERSGDHLRVLDVLEMAASTGGGAPGLLGRDWKPEHRPDVVLARVGNWRPEAVLATLEALEALGVPAVNSADAIRAGRDHWRTTHILNRAGLAVPRTLTGPDPEVLAAVAAEEIGFPVVVKSRRSRMGVGVIRCLARDHLEAVLDSLWRMGEEFVVQQFVGTPGVSVRALVIGGRLAAAARFEAGPGEWRSNGARGARATTIDLDPPGIAQAEFAVRSLGLGLAGVDLLESPEGWTVCEVNPTPGITRLQEATGVDVAGAIVAKMSAIAAGANRV